MYCTARNVLLITLLWDDAESDSPRDLWDIFHAFYIDASNTDLIREQANKLVLISQSSDTWTSSPYGKHLHLLNDDTRETLCHIWDRMTDPPNPSLASFTELKTRFATHECEPCHLGNVSLDFGQACGPRSCFTGWKDVKSPILYFLWNHGLIDKYQADPSNGSSGPIYINPLVAYSQQYGEKFLQHQDISPYYGFHLAPSLSGCQGAKNLLPKAGESARAQFRQWIAAFHSSLRDSKFRNNFQLRFIVSEAMSFAAAFGPRNARENVYSRPWSAKPFQVDIGKNNMPTNFNVVETGYVVDRVGFLNLAPHVIPVLKPHPAVSVLYTSTRKTFVETEKDLLKNMLCGDVGIMCTLLGIAPPAYASGVTTRGHVQDNPQSTHPFRFLDNRITWKSTTSDSPLANIAMSRPHFEVGQLSKFLFKNLYCGMFPYEFPEKMSTDLSQPSFYRSNFYTKRSFTTLLRFFERRLYNRTSGRDWEFAMKTLLERLTNHYIGIFHEFENLQEMTIHWNLHSLNTPKGRIPVELPYPDASTYRCHYGYLRRQTPAGICVLVLTIPSSTVQKIRNVLLVKHFTISLNVVVKNPDDTLDVFRSIQPIFGRLVESSDGESGIIEQDLEGWYGSAELHLCLYIPTSICVSDDPKDIRVSARIDRDYAVYNDFRRHFGEMLEIFDEKLLTPRRVHVFESLPGLMPPKSSWTVPDYPKSPIETETFSLQFPKLDIVRREFTQVIEIKTQKERANIDVNQTSSCTVLISHGNDQQECTFPFPITDVRHTLVTSGSVKLTAALVSPSNRGTYSTQPFPLVRLSDSMLANWNLPYVNLQNMQRLEIDQDYVKWINGFLLSMFSDRETRYRGNKSDLLTNFKNILHIIFTKLQTCVIRLKPQNYSLTSDPNDSDLPIILFITGIYFDFNSHSVMAEAYVLPITPDIRLFGSLSGTDVTMNDEDMKFWRRALPAMVERCRDWSHKPTCEYRSQIPVSVKKGESPICSCGLGKVSPNFDRYFTTAPVKPLLTRIAISPIFAAAHVDSTRTLMDALARGTLDKLDIFQYLGAITDDMNLENPEAKFRCKVCGKGDAKKCSKCMHIRYCSKECQAHDWSSHKTYCKRFKSQ